MQKKYPPSPDPYLRRCEKAMDNAHSVIKSAAANMPDLTPPPLRKLPHTEAKSELFEMDPSEKMRLAALCSLYKNRRDFRNLDEMAMETLDISRKLLQNLSTFIENETKKNDPSD